MSVTVNTKACTMTSDELQNRCVIVKTRKPIIRSKIKFRSFIKHNNNAFKQLRQPILIYARLTLCSYTLAYRVIHL